MRNTGIKEHKALLEKNAKEGFADIKFGFREFQKTKKMFADSVVFGKNFIESVLELENEIPSLFMVSVDAGQNAAVLENMETGEKKEIPCVLNNLKKNEIFIFNTYILHTLKISPKTFTTKSFIAFKEEKGRGFIMVLLARRGFVCSIVKETG